MEKIEILSLEEKEACDYIKHQRKYARKMYFRKSITQHITIDDQELSIVISISINKRTGNVRKGQFLKTKSGLCICPTKNHRLRCTNIYALNSLRSFKKKFDTKRRYEFNFHTCIQRNISLSEKIHYYFDNGNIGVTYSFYSSHGIKLKVIDEFNVYQRDNANS